MTDMAPLDQRFDRARSVTEKLMRYLEVERQYLSLQAQLRELEKDDDVRRSLRLDAETSDVSFDELQPVPPQQANSEPAALLTSAGDEGLKVPRSPGGRLQRGFIDGLFPGIAERRFAERPFTISQMCDVLSEELGIEVSRGTVQSVVRRAVSDQMLDAEPGADPAAFIFKPERARVKRDA